MSLLPVDQRAKKRVRYYLAIAGTLVIGHSEYCRTCFADFSSANFRRVWAEEFGLGLVPAAKPQVAATVPHPAVARIVVPEGEAISFGSGTLVDVREGFGIVITNWHVVRDAKGSIEVIFPGGFTSKARALKMDADWDLAALVIWQPPVEPVKLATAAPQPGDPLTICGYGAGIYRSATGRCTQYYAPREDFPQQMVELSVEARQGDSGGPILNSRGELAGVLFGASDGTTLGSFSGRVGQFLGTLAPDIGCKPEAVLASAKALERPEGGTWEIDCHGDSLAGTSSEWQSIESQAIASKSTGTTALLEAPVFDGLHETKSASVTSSRDSLGPQATSQFAVAPIPTPPPHQPGIFEKIKSGLAAFGVFALVVMLLKAAG